MHILVVHEYFLGKDESGGSRWNQFAKYWSQKGHKITVLAGTVHYATGTKPSSYKGRLIVTEKESERITVKRCFVAEAYNKSKIGRAFAYVSFIFSSIIAGLLSGRPEVIICSSPPLTVGLSGFFLSHFWRVPMVFEVRDLWPESVIDLGAVTNKHAIKVMYWIQKISYGSAKWINVLTPAFEEFLVDVNKVPREKISMIPNGADLDIIAPGPKHKHLVDKYGLNGKFVVTYVGAHGVTNALTQILEAADLLQKMDPSVQILFIGDGIKKPELIQQAKTRNLTNVTFIAPVSKNEIGDYINTSDVCTAVLKKIESFKTVYPNKVFDYMAAAKPVIIGIDGVARKLVEDADCGIYVEPENPHAFVEALLKLKNNPQLCEKYGRNGLNFVTQNFKREFLAEKYLNILINKVVCHRQ